MQYHQSISSVLNTNDSDGVVDPTYELCGGAGNQVTVALKFIDQGSRAVAIIDAGPRLADLMGCSAYMQSQIARDFQVSPKLLVILSHYQVNGESGREGFARLLIDDRGRGHGRTNFGWEPFAGPDRGYARVSDLLGKELFASWYSQLS